MNSEEFFLEFENSPSELYICLCLNIFKSRHSHYNWLLSLLKLSLRAEIFPTFRYQKLLGKFYSEFAIYTRFCTALIKVKLVLDIFGLSFLLFFIIFDRNEIFLCSRSTFRDSLLLYDNQSRAFTLASNLTIKNKSNIVFAIHRAVISCQPFDLNFIFEDNLGLIYAKGKTTSETMVRIQRYGCLYLFLEFDLWYIHCPTFISCVAVERWT